MAEKKIEDGRLCLTVKEGDIVTIGDNILICINRLTAKRCEIIFKAPRNMLIRRHKYVTPCKE